MSDPTSPTLTEAEAFERIRRHPKVVYARRKDCVFVVQFVHGLRAKAESGSATFMRDELDLIERAYGPVPADAPPPVERIPTWLWGRDHFTVFAYAWHVCHKDDTPDPDKMRSKSGSLMATAMQRFLHGTSGKTYPSRLVGDDTLEDHDDWDCAEDLIAEGLMRNVGTGMHPVWKLTERGARLGSVLVRHYREVGGMGKATWDWLVELDRELAAEPAAAAPVQE